METENSLNLLRTSVIEYDCFLFESLATRDNSSKNE